MSVTLNGAALTANQSYYLIPDRLNSGVSTAIEFPSQRDVGWPGLNRFDINYNHVVRGSSTLPNNLAIDGNWGHLPYPDELLGATKVLAAFLTIRPDAVLSGAKQTPEGNTFDLSGLPVEVNEFIANWRITADSLVSI